MLTPPTVVDLFAERAAREPERIAVRCGNESLTYGQLDAASRRVAAFLRDRLPPDDALVAVFLERSTTLVTTLLGVLRSGAAYLPLDPAFPDDRIAYMLADSRAALTVTEAALEPRLRGLDARAERPVVRFDLACDPAGDPAPAARTTPAPGDLAYVLYTSGSTGRPKGVEIEHGSLANIILSFRQRPGLAADDVFLAVTTISFDIAALELYLPLICGARLVLAPSATARDGVQLRTLLGASGATTMQATPSTWRMLFAAGWEGDPGLSAWCGGEALPRSLANELRARCRAVWNLYGPTETTIWSSLHEVQRAEPEAVASIGLPIARTSFAVLDAQLETAAPGVPGELYIGGAGVARGYRGQPALTAQRFVPDPRTAARLYRTGDVVTRAADGSVHFLGRADQQVKIRGFRVEIGEIESVLDRQPGVVQSVVVACSAGTGEQRLVAYLRKAPGAPIDTAALPDALRGRLPAYMVPSAFVTLEEFPMTPNGKIDRRALPVPEPERAPSRAPRTAVERALCAAISECFRLDDVGVDDDFFVLGGDSVSSMQLVGRARAAGVVLTQNDVFAHPTVAALAAAAAERDESPAPASEPPPMNGAVLPLAPLQRELQAAVRTAGAPDAFRVQLAVELTGDLEEERLRSATDAIVRRYPNLRTTFLPDGSGQTFAADARVGWRVVDARALDAATAEARRTQLAAEEHGTPFAAGATRIRFLLLRLDAERYELIFTFDHAVLDGWSLPIFFDELFALYADPAAELPPVRPYVDYLRWLAGLDRAAALASWRAVLADLDGPTLVASAAPAAMRRNESVEASVSLDGTAALRRLARERAVTLNTVVQALWARELARLTGRDDVVFGMTVAGRPPELAGTDRMVGLFTNTVPVRARAGATVALSDTIDAIAASQPNVLAGQYLSLSEIDGAADAFDTLYVFQNYPRRGPLGLPDGIRITAVRGRGEETHFALNLMVVPEERLRLRFDYDASRVDRDRVEAGMASLVQSCESAAATSPLPSGEDSPANPFDREDAPFMVLINDEEQYSLWPQFRAVPRGWRAVGPRGDRQTCLDWIEANWVDMRPRSLRST